MGNREKEKTQILQRKNETTTTKTKTAATLPTPGSRSFRIFFFFIFILFFKKYVQLLSNCWIKGHGILFSRAREKNILKFFLKIVFDVTVRE
jgi:hypothetical protein